MHHSSLVEQSRALQAGKYSSYELTQHYLQRISTYDTTLNCFITVTKDQALQQAEQADRQIKSGKFGPLTGIPIAYKDNLCTHAVKTSCASKMLDNFISPYAATLVQQLEHAGCIMLGKTNLDEFAMGSSTESSFYGPTLNPWQHDTVPGGSSGGSAAAVAARLVAGAIGTDTGGSIRQPAAMCGITGLKPTYGRVSRFGMIAYASSLDQAGPMAQSAEDLALLLSAMSGHDPKDSTSLNQPIENFSADLNKSLTGLKIGLPREYFSPDLDPAIQNALQEAIKTLQKLGGEFQEIDLPHTSAAIPAYYVIAPAECSSNLSRFDGVRFGYRCDNAKDLDDLYSRSRTEGFGHEVKRRIMTGTYVLSAGYYDAYYLKAQQLRRLISQDFANAFQQVDIILGPTTPTTAFKLGEKTQNPIDLYLADIYTTAVNLAGLPALSLPIGFNDQLPIGMQLIGPYCQESRLLNTAHRYQQETDWHKRIPNIYL